MHTHDDPDISSDRPRDDEQIARSPGVQTGRAVAEQLAAVLLRVPRYLGLSYRLIRDARLTAGQRALAAAAAAYTVSPIDPVPGIIPVLGQLDDLAVLLLGLRRTVRAAPQDVAAEHLSATGLSLEIIDADLRTVRATAIWVATTTGKAVARGAQAAAHTGARYARQALGALSGRVRGRQPPQRAPDD